ncbi:MAG: class I SAM-dependent rRNA methyltransferase [Bacteroidota bacterium]
MHPIITLKKNEDKRIRRGHLWAFSNEIQTIENKPEAGCLVELQTSTGKYLGTGLYHPGSLIAVRIISFSDQARELQDLDRRYFTELISAAFALRKKIYPDSETFRVVHGESDFLPGLIVDKYNEYLSVQTLSLGMDKRLPAICDALEDLFHPKGIVERNDAHSRTYEGLLEKKGILRGSIEPVTINEDGVQFTIDLLEGQKTGFFLDQRENRRSIRSYANNARVLDCFCNYGGFAFHAAAAGATSIDAVEISEHTVDHARANAQLNGFDSKIVFHAEDVFRYLKIAVQEGKRYDLINLDPPSFTQNKKSVPPARQGYKELHTNAFRLLSHGGILSTSSCSHHIFEETFLEIIAESAREAGKNITMLTWRGAAPDHPVLPAMPETKYLKFGIFCVL